MKMTEDKLREILRETNPGLTNQELDELVNALIGTYPKDPERTYGEYIEVPKRLVQESLEAVDKLRSTYENIAPQEVEDILLINELKTLRYHLSEILQKY